MFGSGERMSRPNSAVERTTVIKARRATLTMSNGRTLVDLASGGFGFGDRAVISAVGAQIRALPLSNRSFLSAPLGRLIREVAGLCPRGPQVVYPTNSGSEAVDAALKLAFGFHRKRRVVVSCIGAHHGSELAPRQLAATGHSSKFVAFESRRVAYGDTQATLDALGPDVAALVVEPVGTHHGVTVPPAEYLQEVRRACDRAGVLLIFDEIGTCLGRTGHFLASKPSGVEPDIRVLGGALGGGVLPIAVCVSTAEINGKVYGRRHPALHGSTTGGNPAACVAALTALEQAREQGLAARARGFEATIRSGFEDFFSRYSGVTFETRSVGLMAAVRVPSSEFATRWVAEARDRGVLLEKCRSAASQGAWVAIRPPLMVTEEELARGLRAALAALGELCESSPNRVSAAI